jgi:hypothetical protein
MNSDVFLTSSYYNSEDVLYKMIEILNSKIEEARPLATGEDWSIMVIVQPWPKVLWQRNADNGIGNVLGLDRFDENMIRASTLHPLHSAHTNKSYRSAVRLLLGLGRRRRALPPPVRGSLG